jgi:hypothetical protein
MNPRSPQIESLHHKKKGGGGKEENKSVKEARCGASEMNNMTNE